MTIAVAVTCKPLEFVHQSLMKHALQAKTLTEKCPYPGQYYTTLVLRENCGRLPDEEVS
jgi:hypothetical protein